MTIYDEFIAAGNDIIDEFSPNGSSAVLVVTGPITEIPDTDKPWRRNRDAANYTYHAVNAIFLPGNLEDRQNNNYGRGGSTATGQTDGYLMPVPNVKLELTDFLWRPNEDNNVNLDTANLTTLDYSVGFTPYKVRPFDELRPSRTTVMYILELGI